MPPALAVHWADKHQPSPDEERTFLESTIAFGNVPAAWVQKATRLRWMQLESVGFEYYQELDLARMPAGFRLANLKGQFARPAAETVLAGLLALYRGLDELIPAQQRRQWICLELRPRMGLLHGKSVVVLGAGSIGRKLADLLRAFECRVEMYARTAPDATLRTPAELDARLGEFDIVVCCLPKTHETLGFFNRERLARLAPHAIFVNVGRGGVVEEPALVEALEARRLGGAVLDVHLDEPLPPGHPLWSCPRTLLTQHTGGGYDEELLDKARTFLANLACDRAGQDLQNIVTLSRGY